MTEQAWNPRFAAYAAAHGKGPQEMLDHDRKAWPGGAMCGFILWIREKRGDFAHAHPEAFCCGGILDHEAWDRFLGVPA